MALGVILNVNKSMHFDIHSECDFLWSLPGFVYLADIFTDFQYPVRTVDDQRDSSSVTGNSFKALSAAGINANNIAIYNITTHIKGQ